VERFGASGIPKCRNFPSPDPNPWQISRNDWACPKGQNIIATNGPQHENPFVRQSAPVFLTIPSNSTREMTPKICAKMLVHLFTVFTSSWYGSEHPILSTEEVFSKSYFGQEWRSGYLLVADGFLRWLLPLFMFLGFFSNRVGRVD
jgi:hypothetical protein